jgi:cytochrome o ubiquinol oxidase subunit III
MNATHHEDQTDEVYSKTIFGFWVYLMTDAIFFAMLFASYFVLKNATFGGPAGKDLFDLPASLVQTLVFLTSSFTFGPGMVAAYARQQKKVFFWFALTALLGVCFLCLQMRELGHIVEMGHNWSKSAFLSAFFTLVATHTLHIVIGLLWIFVMMAQISVCGLTSIVIRRLTCLRLFWHFLYFVWVFVFTLVYLLGAI